ncbi:MAG: hypothetical protein H0Z32_09865 [Bacillaceae bacterium]|nr:hypothetical protein [Bacillaceae bacterium]
MKEDLQRYYSFEIREQIPHSKLDLFQVDNGYIIVRSGRHITEKMLYEQYMMTSFMQRNGFSHVAVPVYSDIGSFLVTLERGKIAFVCFARKQAKGKIEDIGSFLASFHEAGSRYPYTPEMFNRYGLWKQNWERIIDEMEQVRDSLTESSDWLTSAKWKKLWIETSFYYIGLAENAIQFLTESERDQRFTRADQGGIALNRISPYPNEGFILPFRLVHDHPSRDLAEAIRELFIQNGTRALPNVRKALKDYENQRSLSAFGKRLIFARLLFPVHFIDFTKEVIEKKDFSDQKYEELKKWLRFQSVYEQCLKSVFYELFQDDRSIPNITWLQPNIGPEGKV